MTGYRKTKNKKFSFILALLTICLLLTACGDKGGTPQTTADKLAEAKLDLVLPDGPIETMIALPSFGLHNSTVSWTSSNQSVIGNDGIVVARPVNDLLVVFTANISLDSETIEKEFTVAVKERDKSVYKADFTNGNADIFYGDIIEKESTIIVKDTGFTRFGKYRSVFNDGFATGIEIYLDPDAFSLGEYFTWAVAISDPSGQYLTEKFVNFRKTAGGLMVGTAGTNSSDECNLASVESETASIISEAGFYTVVVRYYDASGFLMIDCQVVKTSDNSVIHSETYEVVYYVPPKGNERMAVSLAGGNRYGWFSLMTAESGIEVRSVWLGNA